MYMCMYVLHTIVVDIHLYVGNDDLLYSGTSLIR